MMEPKGYVTVKIEVFNAEGERTNIECFSLSKQAFLAQEIADVREFNLNLRQAIDRTIKEIITPTPKTDMV